MIESRELKIFDMALRRLPRRVLLGSLALMQRVSQLLLCYGGCDPC